MISRSEKATLKEKRTDSARGWTWMSEERWEELRIQERV